MRFSAHPPLDGDGEMAPGASAPVALPSRSWRSKRLGEFVPLEW